MNTSKITYIILFIANVLLFTACRKDDDDTVNDNEQVAGTWHVTKRMIISGKDGSVLENHNLHTCEEFEEHIFSGDGSYRFLAFSKVSGNCVRDESDDANGTFSYDATAKKIEIKPDGSTVQTLAVPVLTASEMRVQELEGYDENNDGFEDFETVVLSK